MSDASLPDQRFWQALGWEPTAQQLQTFVDLQRSLREWNSKVNLTRLVEDDDYWINQIFDSLWPLKQELQTSDQARRCIDVGTGGGFPGLAAAIALPNSHFTLVDSVGRKTSAVEAMAETLGLASRVVVRTERIEATGRDKQCRGRFDIAMARAVASAPIVAEYLTPLLTSNGQALLYRGQWDDEQQAALQQACRILKTSLIEVQKTDLPNQRGIRHVLRLSPQPLVRKRFPERLASPAKPH